MKQVSPLLLVFLSIIGLADAGYITYEKVTGVIPVCGSGFDCGTVLASPYSQIGPVPISVLGILFYLSVFILSSGLFLGISPFKINLSWLLKMLSGFGFAFSLILIALMAFVIEAWCLYCLISAATSTLIFLTSQFLLPIKKVS